jgi:F0F1-type ATP synthase delta subunit
MVINMGNKIIDGSMLNRLRNLKKKLLKVALT